MKACSHYSEIDVKELAISLQSITTPQRLSLCKDCDQDLLHEESKYTYEQHKHRITVQKRLIEISLEKYKNGIVVCLGCLNHGCGRYDQRHALNHYEEAQHGLSINLKNCMIWCYECDNDLLDVADKCSNATHKHNLHEFVVNVQKIFQPFQTIAFNETPNSHRSSNSVQIEKPKEENKSEVIVPTQEEVEEFMLSFRGFKNLGNTCFFNSTLQCINATTDLVLTYVLHRKDDFPFPKGSLNSIVRSFFFDVRSQQKETFNPSLVFSAICKKIARFRGYQQQDAHDLLINFMDLLVQENDTAYKRTKDQKMKGHNKSIIEETFGGFYLNTMVCLECHRVSRTRDPLLDIELTIQFKKNQGLHPKEVKSMLASTASAISTGTKQRKMSKIGRLCCRFKSKSRKVENGQSLNNSNSPSKAINGHQDITDQSVSEKLQQNQQKHNQQDQENQTAYNTPYKSISQSDAKSSIQMNSGQNFNNHDEYNLTSNTLPTPIKFNQIGSPEKEMQFEVGKRFCVMVDMAKIPYFEDSDKYVFFEPKPDHTFDQSTIQGCLSYASKIENMKDKNNLYLCEMCTEDKYGKKSKKAHRTEALKRFLILEPPKCLIINLKRFSQFGFHFSKNSQKVSFPFKLELDQYMIHKVDAKDSRTINKYNEAREDEPWSPRFVYQLYGVVCHQGEMGGGHYISYVNYHYKEKSWWFKMSDSFVREVSLNEVLGSEAYILFYKRILN